MTFRPSIASGAPEMTDTQARKHAAGLCIEHRCPNRAERKTSGRGYKLRCCTHRSREYAERNCVRVKWLNLKKSAKRRGISFGLYPYEMFEMWAAVHGYTEREPRGAEGMTVDRKDETQGYEWGNVTTLTRGENSRKAAEFRRKSYVPYYQLMGICG